MNPLDYSHNSSVLVPLEVSDVGLVCTRKLKQLPEKVPVLV